MNKRTNYRNNKRRGMTPRQRQMIQRKFGILLSIIVLAVILSVFIGGIGNTVKAADNYHKYYTSIEIMPGDTLSDYYETYGEHYNCMKDYTKEVCMINGIEVDEIVAGNYLIVPYYSLEQK